MLEARRVARRACLLGPFLGRDERGAKTLGISPLNGPTNTNWLSTSRPQERLATRACTGAFGSSVKPIDFRPCPFGAHAEPIVVTIPGEQPAYVIACPECGATGPK